MDSHSTRSHDAVPPTARDLRWLAVVTRDRTADGAFFYSVASSGVFCRPSCAARLANPRNVRFHQTAADAAAAGFRPCKRCRPDRLAHAVPLAVRAPSGERGIRLALGKCSLGTLLVAVGDDGICAIDLDEKPEALVHRARRRWSNAAPMSDEIAASRLIAQVARSIEAPRRTVELPLDPQGTRFQRRVWRELSAIPAGRTTSYSDIARRLGSPGAARAVAAACAANKLAVAIPCHRVVRNDGTLAGYRWGAARKRELLAREATAR